MTKKFQGVLLDSNKGNLPFGVYSLHPAFTKQPQPAQTDNNLHSVSQRYLYQEPQYAGENTLKSKKPGPKSKPQSKQKMTIRLRPRKVLCSNCQGICNENNENVELSKKRKVEDIQDGNSLTEPSRPNKKYLMSSMLIPKISRLQPSEISSAIKGTSKNLYKASDAPIQSEQINDSEPTTQEMAFVSVSEVEPDNIKEDNNMPFSSMFPSARTLKICFGEGEGTVVKIPPVTGDFNEDSGVSCDMSKPDLKAVKKALKKAKKQARKNSATKMSQPPKYIGALSPRNNVTHSPSRLDPLEKKHKHRVKHKKKKVQKKSDENRGKSAKVDQIDYFSDIKEHCIKQKLSISLRRLSSNSYEKRSDTEIVESSSDCDTDLVPDFPANVPGSGNGRLLRVSPGDIVWGKVVGFPWWPGRVLSVTSSSRAHVAWYASTTSSHMRCDSLSPFLEDFKIRFNKKKRGPYKDAVKQATLEAKQNESQVSDPLASPTNLDAMSPRPIDVFS